MTRTSAVDLYVVITIDKSVTDAEIIRERLAFALDEVAERVLQPGWDGAELEFVDRDEAGNQFIVAEVDVSLVDPNGALAHEVPVGTVVGEA